jgi:threonine synthase
MFVTHLECALCSRRFPPDKPAAVCPDDGKPLWVRYDLFAVRSALAHRSWDERPAGMWRYRELSPVPESATPVSLGEVESPVLAAPRLAAEVGLRRLWIKDEGRLPTESFKARGMAMAVSMMKEFAVKTAALPSAGNAGGAAAAYCARAGIEVHVFMPRDVPLANRRECELFGARVTLVDGLISDCGKIVAEKQKTEGWFNLATLREPYRIEGKKTMGLELASQFKHCVRRTKPTLPDAIIYPTGGGTGLIGMWKAFAELRELGDPFAALPVCGGKQPRLYSVQADGCAPIVRAFDAGKRFAEPFPNAATEASGLRVPAALGDFMILDAVRDSGGSAVCGQEKELRHWMRRAGVLEGISLCPEAAIGLSGLKALVAAGAIRKDEHVLLFNTASAGKYGEIGLET